MKFVGFERLVEGEVGEEGEGGLSVDLELFLLAVAGEFFGHEREIEKGVAEAEECNEEGEQGDCGDGEGGGVGLEVGRRAPR